MKKITVALACLAMPVWAVENANIHQSIRQQLQQGGYALLQVPSPSTVRLSETVVPVVSHGGKAYALLGFGRKASSGQTLEICEDTQSCITETLAWPQRMYTTQRVGTDSRTPLTPEERLKPKAANPTTPTPAELAQYEAERADEHAARAAAAEAAAGGQAVAAGFLQTFIAPLEGPRLALYGALRTFDGGRRPDIHYGVDIAAPLGSPVRAPAAGLVRLARQEGRFGGKVIIDHGAGLTSEFVHLGHVLVKEGQQLEQGAQVGMVGPNPLTPGGHLHWGMAVGHTAVDPELWLNAKSTGR